MADGAWIFLSHSHKDFDQVRELRNELEKLGHHPLLFFLKCLDDDSEIDDLIRREIEARSWFVLCDSANAQASRWVQQEREIIGGLQEHNAATVTLADPLPDQLDSLSTLTKRASVFLSYAAADRAIASRIESTLRAKDFGVFFDLQNVTAGGNWQAEIESAVDRAARHGAVVVLLSRAALGSRSQRQEIELALGRADPLERRTHIVPVYLEPRASIWALLTPRLREVEGVDFSTGEFPQNMRRLMRVLRRYEWHP